MTVNDKIKELQESHLQQMAYITELQTHIMGIEDALKTTMEVLKVWMEFSAKSMKSKKVTG